MRITNSELQSFKRCRRRWWLAHHRGLVARVPQVTGPLAIGDRVHKALLVRYRGGSWVDELVQLHARDRTTLELARGIVVDGEGSAFLETQVAQLDKDHELATKMLEGYEQWVAEEGVDADLEIRGLECTLETPLLDEEGVTLLGKLDQRAFRPWDQARVFRDFKTAGNLTDPAKTLPRDEQALTYMCLEHATAARSGTSDPNERFDVALFTILRKVQRTVRATPPFYGQLEVRHPIHELRRFWLRLKEEAREILRLKARIQADEDPAIVAYPSPRRDCTWDCQFYHVCPMFDNGDDAEGYIEEHFQVGDPLARYAGEADA